MKFHLLYLKKLELYKIKLIFFFNFIKLNTNHVYMKVIAKYLPWFVSFDIVIYDELMKQLPN